MSKPFHILVTDDNELNQQVLLGMLTHAGYLVDLASNGVEALDRLSQTRYDLLILDCMMPVMDGFETTKVIRSSDGAGFDPNIPILGITALATNEDREKCLVCGMSNVLTKPVAAQVLFSRLEEMLEKERPDQQTPVRFENDRGVPVPEAKRTAQNNKPVDMVQIIRSMSATLIHDTEQWIFALVRLQEARDFPQLSGLAHKIRGTADLLNDNQLSALARDLEQSSKAEDGLVTTSLVSSLVAELKRLESELESSSNPE